MQEDLAAAPTVSGESCETAADSAEPLPKRNKTSVLDKLLGAEEETTDAESASVQEEVTLYFREKAIKRADDPLLWWKVNESRSPHLAVLARRYLAIPATSTPSESVLCCWYCC